jgi:hypothetical protein
VVYTVADKTPKKKTTKKIEEAVEKSKKTADKKKSAGEKTSEKKKTVKIPGPVKNEAPVKAKPPAVPAVKEKAGRKPSSKKVKDTDISMAEDETVETEIEASKFFKPEPAEDAAGGKTKEEIKPQERHETTIPDKYGDNRVVLMTRDPHWCYVYWDLSVDLMASKAKTINEKYDLVLRVYDITDVNFDGSNSHKYIDIQVNGEAGNWYINVWDAGKTYIVDVGYKTVSGKFILLARSNGVNTPDDKVSNFTDEEWMIVDEDFDELFRLSGGGKSGRMGSSEGSKSPMESGLSSETVSSFSSPTGGQPDKHGFFLVADTELILYGATEKDAAVKVKGDKVTLKDDGSFSMRFHLPDGKIDLPIEATSSDGLEKRYIKISVERKTE